MCGWQLRQRQDIVTGICFAGDNLIFFVMQDSYVFVHRLEASRHQTGQGVLHGKSPQLFVSINVVKWPEVLHLCMQRPVELTPEELDDGVQIEGQNYQIIGVIHQKEGDWIVCCKAAKDGCWRKLSSSGIVQVGFPAYIFTHELRLQISNKEYPRLKTEP